MGRIGGHLWTLGPYLARSLRPPTPPAATPWRRTLEDPVQGPVRLTGDLSATPGADAVVVLVHGLGGDRRSGYLAAGARAAVDAGLAALRLGLRGSEGDGEDLYHAGWTGDVAAALASPELAGYERVLLLGYSLGGHVALRYATEPGDPRLAAAAAVCSPLDLDRGARAIDAPRAWAYRRAILRTLTAHYAALAARGRGSTPAERVRRVRTIREFDELTVAPRHGFASAEDYYARASVAPRLGALRVPALLVASPDDPMVPRAAVPVPADAGRLDVRWTSPGGHLGFPARVDLGERGPPGVHGQVVAWLRGHHPHPQRGNYLHP